MESKLYIKHVAITRNVKGSVSQMNIPCYNRLPWNIYSAGHETQFSTKAIEDVMIFSVIKDECEQIQLHWLHTRILRHSWREDPAGGQDVPSRKSCCLKVPSSLALHTTLGFPTSTFNQKKLAHVIKSKKKKKLTVDIHHYKYLSKIPP